MPRFFIEEKSLFGDSIIISGADARHIGFSLRMKIGDSITFCREGEEFLCEISEMTGTEVKCRILGRVPSDSEPGVKLTIYQALPKSDKLETVIQKTVELGAYRIVPFISKRCVSRPDEKAAEKKLARYRKIAEEAAKQSGRGIIPDVPRIMTFGEALDDAGQTGLKLICYENGGSSLSDFDFKENKNICVMIGAEGGFEFSEIEAAEKYGFSPVWLGKRILRCETCPTAVTAVIMNLTGNF